MKPDKKTTGRKRALKPGDAAAILTLLDDFSNWHNSNLARRRDRRMEPAQRTQRRAR